MSSNVCPGTTCSVCGFRSEVFQTLSTDQLEQLTRRKSIRAARKGDIIAKQGSQIMGFIFLRTGLAKLTRLNAEGRQQIVGIATPNDFVGLLSVFSSDSYHFSIIALEDSEYCCVDLELVKELVVKEGKFAMSLLEKISRVSDLLLQNRLNIDLLQLRGRVAYIICYFANEVYRQRSFNLPISRREIAELIDMRVENVVRILSEFRRDGIITIEGTAINILKPEKLRWIKEHG